MVVLSTSANKFVKEAGGGISTPRVQTLNDLFLTSFSVSLLAVKSGPGHRRIFPGINACKKMSLLHGPSSGRRQGQAVGSVLAVSLVETVCCDTCINLDMCFIN